MGLRLSLAERTTPWTRRHQVHDPEKSDHYPPSVKVFVMAIDALVSLALAAGMSRKITLSLMIAVFSMHRRGPQPCGMAGSRRIDPSCSKLDSLR